MCIYQADEYDNYSDWEINNHDGIFGDYIAELEKLPPDDVFEPFAKHEDAAEYTNKIIAEMLREWEANTDPRDEVIRIHWF